MSSKRTHVFHTMVIVKCRKLAAENRKEAHMRYSERKKKEVYMRLDSDMICSCPNLQCCLCDDAEASGPPLG